MNGGLVPVVLLSATVGLLLAFVSLRRATMATIAFAATATAASSGSFGLSTSVIFAGLWLSTIAAAVLIYIPVERWSHAAIPVSLNAGYWLGASAPLMDSLAGLLIGVLLLFISIPARKLAGGKFNIAIKVVASWMIAIASLSLFVSLLPTPGYKADHME